MSAARRDVRLAVGALLAVATTIALLRAVLVSITHDEATALRASMHAPTSRVLWFTTHGLPDNNHLLYSLVVRPGIWLFGEHEWTLRLPAVVAGAFYGIAMAMLLRRFVDGWLLVALLAVAVLNPPVLEAMSLARGYGLGIALLCWGVYWLLRADERPLARPPATRATLLFGLATLAHLTFILYWTIAWGVLLANAVSQRRAGRATWPQLGTCLLPSLVTTLAVAPIVVNQVVVLRSLGLLSTEGLTSFVADTLRGTVALSLGPGVASIAPVVAYAAFLVPAALGLLLWRARARPSSSLAGPVVRDAAIVGALLVGACALSVVQHAWFGAGYLSGRRATSLVPLFVLVCAAVAGLWARQSGAPRLVRAVAGMACVLALVPQLRTITFDTTAAWRFDADTRQAMTDLECLFAAHPRPASYRVSVPWELEPAANYYRTHLPVPRLAAVDRGGVRPGFDAYYLPQTVEPQLARSLNAVEASVGALRVLAHYPRADAVLAVPADSALAADAAAAARCLGLRGVR
ncbi:MAG: hypothetical protein JSR18_10035 [Proteobacteria bacterium]|nr:hypothetical protein [Pseudomonadota bacterium]